MVAQSKLEYIQSGLTEDLRHLKKKISVPVIKDLRPSDKPYEVVDTLIKGFLARVQPSGAITYYFSYRTLDGTRRRYRIGTHPTITAPVARKSAEGLAADVVKGADPHQEKKVAREGLF